MSYASPEDRARFIAGLYDLAIFLEDNPEVPAPRMVTIHVFPPAEMPDAEARAEIDAIASRIGAEASESQGGHYSASLYFGLVEYKPVTIPRETESKPEWDEK